MNKRLYQIAKELGLSSKEIVEKIRTLDVSFRDDVKNHLSLLDEQQEAELRAALEEADGPVVRERTAVNAGVIRRRRKRADAEEAPAEEIPAAAAPAAAEEPAVAAEVEEAPAAPVRRRGVDTVVTRKPEELAADEPAAAVEEEAPARQRFSTVVTRDVEPVAAEAEEAEPAEPAPARQRFATVHQETSDEPSGGPRKLSPTELAALARQEVDAGARPGKPDRAARVVGAMNPDLLNTRVDKRPPGPKRTESGDTGGRRRKTGGGRRVVQSRELYDKFSRSRKRQQRPSGPQKQTKITEAAEHKRVVKMEESISVSDLAHQMGVKAGELAMKLMFELGLKGANINTTLDFETAELTAELYNYRVEKVGFDVEDYLPSHEDTADDLASRPPVVTVMGHVDHGKTSLLDKIRDAAVTDTEAGGITQHIGAYLVEIDAGTICFLDTPGHEAFTALRARGALATDIVILVVAADDGVMPQTIEAINHARDAEVPIIVAINKIDKPGANAERIRTQLAEHELVSEEWGGQTIFRNVSAMTGEGIEDLLEMVHLQAEVMELRANPDRDADGLVIESKLDTGRGAVATVLVQGGTLSIGDIVVAGQHYGRVRSMTDERGRRLEEAGPSTPVEITGLSGVPESGEKFYVVEEEKTAKAVADHVSTQARQAELASTIQGTGGVERIAEMMKAGAMKELKVIIKGDVQGSVEAMTDSLQKLSTDKVQVRVVHAAVGAITESDINLAATSGEDSGVVIIGFNVRPETRAHSLAEQLGVTILTHSVIYEAIEQVRGLMVGLLEPVYEEEVVGHAEIRKTFQVPKVGTVAGCMVIDGSITRNAKARVLRDGRVVYESAISSLKRFEDDAREVKSGYECGLSIERFNDLKVGDVIEVFRVNEMTASL